MSDARLTEEQYAGAYEAQHVHSKWEQISEEARVFYRKRYEDRAPFLQYGRAESPGFICAAWRRRKEGPADSRRTLVNRCDLPDGHKEEMHLDRVLLVNWPDSESEPESRPHNEFRDAWPTTDDTDWKTLYKEVQKRMEGSTIVAFGKAIDWSEALPKFVDAVVAQEHLATLASERYDRILELERQIADTTPASLVFKCRSCDTTSDKVPPHQLAPYPACGVCGAMLVDIVEHSYISTACHHTFHDQCRKTCKFCAVACKCECHTVEPQEQATVSRTVERIAHVIAGARGDRFIASSLPFAQECFKIAHAYDAGNMLDSPGNSERREVSGRDYEPDNRDAFTEAMLQRRRTIHEGPKERVTIEARYIDPTCDNWMVMLDGNIVYAGTSGMGVKRKDADRYAAGLRIELEGK